VLDVGFALLSIKDWPTVTRPEICGDQAFGIESRRKRQA